MPNFVITRGNLYVLNMANTELQKPNHFCELQVPENSELLELALNTACEKLGPDTPPEVAITRLADGLVAEIVAEGELPNFPETLARLLETLPPHLQKPEILGAAFTAAFEHTQKYFLTSGRTIGSLELGVGNIDEVELPKEWQRIAQNYAARTILSYVKNNPSGAIDEFSEIIELATSAFPEMSVDALRFQFAQVIGQGAATESLTEDGMDKLLNNEITLSDGTVVPPVSNTGQIAILRQLMQLKDYGNPVPMVADRYNHLASAANIWSSPDATVPAEVLPDADTDTHIAIHRNVPDRAPLTPEVALAEHRTIMSEREQYRDIPVFAGTVTYMSHFGKSYAHGTPETLAGIEQQQSHLANNGGVVEFDAEAVFTEGSEFFDKPKEFYQAAFSHFESVEGKSVLVLDGHGFSGGFLISADKHENSIFGVHAAERYERQTIISPQEVATLIVDRMEHKANTGQISMDPDEQDMILLIACAGEQLTQINALVLQDPRFEQLASQVSAPILITSAEVGENARFMPNNEVPYNVMRENFQIGDLNHVATIGDLYGVDYHEAVLSNPMVWVPRGETDTLEVAGRVISSDTVKFVNIY